MTSQIPLAAPPTELSRWLSRPGLVDDLHRLAQAEPEIIAVLMAACARHPAPVTEQSPIPEATPFTVVFLERVSEAIAQGIPDDAPAPVGPAPQWTMQSAASSRRHGRVLDPDEIAYEHHLDEVPFAGQVWTDRG